MRLILGLLAALLATPALADGCGGFSLEARKRAARCSPALPAKIANGAEMTALPARRI